MLGRGRLAAGGEVALFDHFRIIFSLGNPGKTRQNPVNFVEAVEATAGRLGILRKKIGWFRPGSGAKPQTGFWRVNEMTDGC